MKKQVLYIHGGESFEDYELFLERLRTKDIWDLPWSEHKIKWTSTFAEDLGPSFEVFTPRMPNAQNAKYEEWKLWFERHFEHLDDGVILVGCSLGAMFLSKYAIEKEFPFAVKALILMASPVKLPDFDDRDCGDFSFSLNEVGSIKDRAEKVVIMHSKDDFVVPFEHGKKYKEALPEAEFVSFEDKNHFLVEELPELIDYIRSI